MNKEILNLIGAIYTFNADASIIENENDALDLWNFIQKCNHHKIITPINGEEFEIACDKLNIDANYTDAINNFWINNGNSLLIIFPKNIQK